jgi:hypothetical protein
MSQTNAFAKAQNPDYVYLDLQQTNVYNNTIKNEVDINFIETRDSPVIANTGDYTVSVTRFQIDTYELPSLLAEPDLITEPFDPERTIHKVAIINEGATLPVENPTADFPLVQELNIPTPTQSLILSYGSTTDVTFDGEFIVVGAPATFYNSITQRGAVYIWTRSQISGQYTYSNILNAVFDNTVNSRVGHSLSISEDGNWIGVGTGQTAGTFTYIIERTTLTTLKIPKPDTSVSNVVLSSDGSIIAVAYPTASNTGNNRGIIQIYKRTGNTALDLIQTINGATNNVFLGNSIGMDSTGSRIIIGSNPSSNTAGVVFVYKNDNPNSSYSWISETITRPSTVPNYKWGIAVSITHLGNIIAIGSSSASDNGEIALFSYDFSNNLYSNPEKLLKPDGGPYQGYGSRVSLSYDGTEVLIGCVPYNDIGVVFVYVKNEGVFEIGSIFGTVVNSNYGYSLSSFNDGRYIVIGAPGIETSNPYGTVVLRKLEISLYGTIPNNIRNHITVENIKWSPNYSPSIIVPTRQELTGKNTVNFPYYWCTSYARFIGQVNDALGEAYVANFNYIYSNWINTQSLATKEIFYNIVARFYSTPPFLEWSNSSLKASLVVNVLFNSLQANYAIVKRLWTLVAENAQHTPDPPIPFNFKIAFNASLYALFNSFPATETVINNEKFYIIDFTHPVPTLIERMYNAIPLYPNYPFLDPFIDFTGIINIPSPLEYGHIGTHIVLEQELSTIDTWCPINGIVFTTNTLPIVINQYTSNATLNSDRPNPEAGADFALIITDLQTNQQGYKPNLLYTPTAEYRRVDMTGNLGLTNIDIRVFWRAKTGQLIPMKLGCGVTASIKLLFQKKLLAEKQQLQLKQFSVKDLKL